ncbi:hypothetical protein [Micromonospora sp. NPDC050695]|uniref:hypothetical protein n=1 Tax=Micromonospora sp. NPDC050695 TaxID=3154938 RepID=UPI0033DC6AAC
MSIAGTAHATSDVGEEVWSPRQISTERLYDGSALRHRYADGNSVITVVAPADAQVAFSGSMRSTTMADGRRSYDRAISVTKRRTLNRLHTATAYGAAGRSVYSDALAAGMSQSRAQLYATSQGKAALDTPPITDSWCAYSEDVEPDPKFEWSGCGLYYEVQFAGDTAYAAHSGTAHGWGTGVLGGGKELQKGYISTEHTNWNPSPAAFDIVEASPSSSTNGPSTCTNFNIGLSQFVELGFSVPLCSDGWDVTWNRTFHKVEWHGDSTGGSSDSRSAGGAHTLRSAPIDGSSWSTSFRIGWTYACFGC